MMGIGMSGLLHIIPGEPAYRGDTLTLAARLENPITDEVSDAVKNGYAFRIEYSVSLIVNGRKSFEANLVRKYVCDSLCRVDGVPVRPDSIGIRMGSIAAVFPRLRFDPGDAIMVFMKARIAEDSAFTRSTGLPAPILWNYYVPRTRTYWDYREGRFHPR